MKCQPQPFDTIDPRLVNRLINYPELRILLQPAQRFTAFVDDVIINNERNRFGPPVRCLQVFQQTDKLS